MRTKQQYKQLALCCFSVPLHHKYSYKWIAHGFVNHDGSIVLLQFCSKMAKNVRLWLWMTVGSYRDCKLLHLTVDHYWCLWMPMDANGWLLVSTDAYWCLWMAIGACGWLLVPVDGYWCLWMATSAYGWLIGSC